MLVSFAAGQALSWRGLAWLGMWACLPVVILLLPLPETPHHLHKTGRREDALTAFTQLRRTAREAEKEHQEISSSDSKTNAENVSFREIIQPPNLWPVGVGAAMMVAQQTTGITAVVFFTSNILDAGEDGLDPGTASTLIGVVNFIGTFVGMFALAIYKRRFLLRLSTVVVVGPLLILSLFFWAQEAGGTMSALTKTLNLVPILALLVYMVGFALGWGPIPWVFLGEGMPSRVRGIAVAAVIAVNWASAFLVTKTFGWCMESLGAHNTFLGYAVLTAISSILIHQALPETFQQSVAQMDQLYLEAAKKKQQ